MSLALFTFLTGLFTGSCLPTAPENDLVAFVKAAPFATRTQPLMAIWETASPEWQAARNVGVTWAQGDCQGFAEAAQTMGYSAEILHDEKTGHSFWVLREKSEKAAYQGVFAFRVPEEVKTARPLVIDAPHMGSDYAQGDERAVRLFLDTDAVAFLQNTAHRCSLPTSSGCSAVSSSYACGAGGVRDSDVVHSVRQGYYAVYEGIESHSDFHHFEYHGAGSSTNAAGCVGTAQVSQASSQQLSAEEDEGTYPSRFWRNLENVWGADCVCYHQREKGCKLNGAASTPGRLTNAETLAGDVCTVKPAGLSKRFIHFETYHVDPAAVAKALIEALPLTLP